MSYSFLKQLHVSCIFITFALFFSRGVLTLAESPLLGTRFLRIAPHVNDTVLLASAIWMVIASGQYPFVENWLTVKLLGLLAYILLGMVAISYGRTRRIRGFAWLAAMLVFAYIVSVAITRSATPFIDS